MTSTEETPLDFEKADFGAPPAGVECSICGSPAQRTYYEVNGRNVCGPCHTNVVSTQQPEGGPRRFALATALGVGGGALGAAIWYAVAELFDLQIGLIAILVGWLVGRGVQIGHGGRGGVKYQVLAAFVAYSSIITTYIPYIYSDIKQRSEAAATTPDASTPVEANPAATPIVAAPRAATAATNAATESPGPPGLGEVIVAIGTFVAILYALPFLAGASNLIGILIIGFAVHQAWKMNRRQVFEIKGPFRIATNPVVTTPATSADRTTVP